MTRPQGATLPRPVSIRTFDSLPLLEMPGWLPRAARHVGDVLGLVGIVFCIPFVILAIGLPIALCLRLVLWIGGRF